MNYLIDPSFRLLRMLDGPIASILESLSSAPTKRPSIELCNMQQLMDHLMEETRAFWIHFLALGPLKTLQNIYRFCTTCVLQQLTLIFLPSNSKMLQTNYESKIMNVFYLVSVKMLRLSILLDPPNPGTLNLMPTDSLSLNYTKNTHTNFFSNGGTFSMPT